MTVLHWVRHGPTHAKTMVGWTDKPADLSDTTAIARLSAFLPSDARLVSSTLTRAVQTAAVLETSGRARLPADARLREIHFGAWEDRSFAEISAGEPEAIAAFWQRPGPTCAPGGESWDMLSTRVSTAADALAELGGEVIVVAHFGAILSQVQRARRQGPETVFAQPIAPLSVTRLRWDGAAWHEELVDHCP